MGKFKALVLVSIAFILLSCSGGNSAIQKYSLSEDGYASVESAPAVIRKISSAEVTSRSSETFRQAAIIQRYAKKAEALASQLVANEAGNFVAYRLGWEPEPHYIFFFLKDAEATLAKYTSNPVFKPRQIEHTLEALEAKSEENSSILLPLSSSPAEISSLTEIDLSQGQVVVTLDVYEQDFETYPGLKTLKNDPMVQLKYNAPLDPPEILSAEVKPLIRYFAYGNLRETQVVIGEARGKILLKDGCFFLDDGAGEDSLLVFQPKVGVGLDDEGYIVLINRSPSGAERLPTRVGEPARWFAGQKAITDPEVLRPLQEACGQHDAVIIGAPMPSEG